MPIRGTNHVTLCVSDLARALALYEAILGFRLRARWTRGAYLEAGDTWLCLELDPRARTTRRDDDSHLAFTVDGSALEPLRRAVVEAGCRIWKENRSEGGSVYFEDHDGHKLELHDGSLASRLLACREHPYEGMQLFD